VTRRDEELLVPDGNELAVAASALTKTLRQGREVEALYWATQIERRFWKYLWRRLAVFAAEDVGIVDPQSVTLIQSLRSAYEQARKESRAPSPDPALVGLAVLHLARAPKSREASEFAQALLHLREGGWVAPVPGEAFDLHTRLGRELMPSRTERLTHWLNVASRSPVTGPLDWTLWIRRWAARLGALDPTEVEDQAQEWHREGRLVHGPDGYVPDEVVY
jgi:hypothetical protein